MSVLQFLDARAVVFGVARRSDRAPANYGTRAASASLQPPHPAAPTPADVVTDLVAQLMQIAGGRFEAHSATTH